MVWSSLDMVSFLQHDDCLKWIGALVAQLDRVSPSEGEGRAFESRRAHIIYSSFHNE
jgi:hypothetical protein